MKVTTHWQWQYMLCDVMCCPFRHRTEEEKEVFRACKTGDPETVQRLVPHVVGSEFRDYSCADCTPLHWAAW